MTPEEIITVLWKEFGRTAFAWMQFEAMRIRLRQLDPEGLYELAFMDDHSVRLQPAGTAAEYDRHMMSNMYGAARALVDSDYKRIGHQMITPFDSAQIQPASYDVTMHDEILLPKHPQGGDENMPWMRPPPVLDLRDMQPGSLMEKHVLGEKGYMTLWPGKVALVCTRETISCPNDMICSVDGKSTLGRCFLAVHVTAGFVDPGFVGRVTLELVNHSPWGFVLRPGMKIGQLRFTWLGVQVDRPYGSPGLGSHYQGSLNVRPAQADVEEL